MRAASPFTMFPFAPAGPGCGNQPRGTPDEMLKPESKGKLTLIVTNYVVTAKMLGAETVKGDASVAAETGK